MLCSTAVYINKFVKKCDRITFSVLTLSGKVVYMSGIRMEKQHKSLLQNTLAPMEKVGYIYESPTMKSCN